MIQFFAETGWKATQTMNLWITGYDSSEESKDKLSASTRNSHASDDGLSATPAGGEGKNTKTQKKRSAQEKRAHLVLQNAIKCNKPESMDELEDFLRNTTKYKMDGTPFSLPWDITVLGLKPTTVAYSGDEDGMSLEFRFPGKTPEKVAKAAGITRNRDGDYHKNTGMGYLNIVMASGEVSLSCTYITGDSEVELQPPAEAGDPAN